MHHRPLKINHQVSKNTQKRQYHHYLEIWKEFLEESQKDLRVKEGGKKAKLDLINVLKFCLSKNTKEIKKHSYMTDNICKPYI